MPDEPKPWERDYGAKQPWEQDYPNPQAAAQQTAETLKQRYPQYFGPQAEEPGFFASAWERLNPMNLINTMAQAWQGGPGAEQARAALSEMPAVVAKTQAKEFKKAGKELVTPGQPLPYRGLSALGHTGAGLIPLVGPPLAEEAEKLGAGVGQMIGGGPNQGQIRSALGGITGILAPNVASAVLPKTVGRGPIVPTVTNPVEEAALSSVEGRIPMTAGQRTQNVAAQRIEQGLQNVPGASSRAQQFYNAQREAIADEGARLVGEVSPVQTDPYGAGAAVRQKGQEHITALKSQADNLYDDVRQATAANTKTLQVGNELTNVVDANGNPVPGKPIMRTFESPIDIRPLQESLRPIYKDLQRSMPIARQQASPAFTTLQDIMNRKINPAPGEISGRYMNAMDFDRALGAVKSLTRDGKNPLLTDRSQGLAKQIVKNGEFELQDALRGAGSDIPGKLASARGKVRDYYDTAELLNELHDEPAQVYTRLVGGGDKVYDQLTKLRKVAPEEVNTVGRTFLEGLMQKATTEGGFGKAGTVMNEWNRMGPRTKGLLFGPKLTTDIDNFMLAAKRLTSVANPSGTANTLAALGTMGAIGTAMVELVTGHPLAAATSMGVPVGANVLSRVLFSPGGAKRLTQAMTYRVNTPGFRTAVGELNARFAPIQQLPPPPEQ